MDPKTCSRELLTFYKSDIRTIGLVQMLKSHHLRTLFFDIDNNRFNSTEIVACNRTFIEKQYGKLSQDIIITKNETKDSSIHIRFP